ncbi:endonuclease/exonuclease/phosphatase family protein [Kribbella deserti]|uniref:Endonuclease/exonuclease/phosphatase family protein n=1 Tax=Kribbella deserti TaxID=1926257 RepID=A0ABV6QWF7_9ACTN
MRTTSERLRVVTLNLLTVTDADGKTRQEVVRAALPELNPDVIALQEVTRGPDSDQAAYLLGPEYTVVDLPGPPNQAGECLASRWPLGRVATLDRPIEAGTGTDGGSVDEPRATAVAVEVLLPPPVGPVLVVHHRGTYELHLEHVREKQALATARFIEDLVADRPVILLGDFNAAPDSASLRFLTGKQSLAGTSVRYEDAWEAIHPGEPGHTFTPRNPLVASGQMPMERGRRIDHILIRSGSHGPLLDVADCRHVFDQPVNGVWASDHFGVLADLQLPPHAPGTWAS